MKKIILILAFLILTGCSFSELSQDDIEILTNGNGKYVCKLSDYYSTFEFDTKEDAQQYCEEWLKNYNETIPKEKKYKSWNRVGE